MRTEQWTERERRLLMGIDWEVEMERVAHEQELRRAFEKHLEEWYHELEVTMTERARELLRPTPLPNGDFYED